MRPAENQPHREDVPRAEQPSTDLPARARDLDGARWRGDEQAPAASSEPRSATSLRVLWVVVCLGLVAGIATLRVLDGPTLAGQLLAAASGVALAIGLAVRSGARAVLFAALAAVVGTGAVATQWTTLLAGAAVGTAVLTACLAVLGTRPAPTLPAVVLEVVLALLGASAGALAVAGWSVALNTERFVYTVLTLAMVATVLLVHRLGGGLHGLGRRGLVLWVGALALLLVVLVYTAALTRYGSPDLVREVRSAGSWTRHHLGGVPHPVEVLVGVPALAWGVSLRSRRRQGWWVCAFGAVATAAAASRLADGSLPGSEELLSSLYSAVLGLLLGLVLIRLERVLTGRGGRHTPLEEVSRREPGRLQPLH